jgi:lactoylglutathione lyase
MRTLHVGLRVTDPERSTAFYRAIGYEVVGRVPGTGIGDLTMLKLPGDDVVTVELVHDPGLGGIDPGTGFSHLVVQVDSLDDEVARLTAAGIEVEDPVSPEGPGGVRTALTSDPDGRRIELVQWPPGHADGLTAADWEER